MAVYRFRKEELEAHLNRGALWAVVYGDLMSYLMILFLIMLSYTLAKKVNPEKHQVEESMMQIQRVFGGKVDPALQERALQRDKEFFASQRLQEQAQKEGTAGSMNVIATEKRVRIELKEGVLFDSGSAELKESAVPILKSIATEMVDLKNEIRVEGHTDNVPIHRGKYKSNWELSMARAYAVLKVLQEAGVSPERLSGIGYGEYRPMAANDSLENKAKNRRIEISLLRAE
ncbi:MAG: OmpA family protein [Elusimicrobiota bacterium]|jgi:chemotaxis protein MotB